MFFLAGVGILRVLYIQFWDVSPSLLRLGDVVYLPYAALTYLFSLVNVDVRWILSFLAIGGGLLVLSVGTVTWLLGKAENSGLVDFWIYRYSRHPQYLGFLVRSYGILLATTNLGFPKGGYFPEPSLPWLLSALIIVCLALKEEMTMLESHGGKYSQYREIVLFFFPLPSFVSKAVKIPARLLIGKAYPENKRGVLYLFVIYGLILVGVSSIFPLSGWPTAYGGCGILNRKLQSILP